MLFLWGKHENPPANNFSSYQRLGCWTYFGSRCFSFFEQNRGVLKKGGFGGGSPFCVVVVFVSFGPGEFVLKVGYRWFAKTKMVMFQLFLLNSDLFQIFQLGQ